MTNEQAAMKISMHLMQCGALMPIKWVEENGAGSDTSEAFRLALDSLRTNTSDHIVDANKMVDDNPPLTLDELRKMDGSWVYIGCERLDAWAIVAAHYYDGTVCLESSVWGCREFRCNKSLDGITVYRRKPEEV